MGNLLPQFQKHPNWEQKWECKAQKMPLSYLHENIRGKITFSNKQKVARTKYCNRSENKM